MDGRRIQLLFDATMLANALKMGASRTGVFFTADNIFSEFLKREEFDISLYCGRSDRGKKVFSKLFRDWDPAKLVFERENLDRFDAFFSPYALQARAIQPHPLLSVHLMLYDIIPLRLPHTFSSGQIDYLDDIIADIELVDRFYAISNYVKRDFSALLPQFGADRISVVTLAANAKFHPQRDPQAAKRVREKYGIPDGRGYVLSLCSLEPRKNLVTALKAFIEFTETHAVDNLVFVLCGAFKERFSEAIKREIPDIDRYRERFILTGYVDDEDLAPLYSNAVWFVYTSQMEGFGLPPLEAMQCGCPVIASNSSSLPEVVGDAGILLDWSSREQHIKAYEAYHFNPALRSANAEKGLVRAAGFGWEKCVDTIANGIMSSLEKRRAKPKTTVAMIANCRDLPYDEAEGDRCAASMAGQDYVDIEPLVVDGRADPAASASLARLAAAKGMRLVTAPGSESADAMNQATEEAHGDCLALVRSHIRFHDASAIAAGVAKLLERDAELAFSDAVQFGKTPGLWRGDGNLLATGEHFCRDGAIFDLARLRGRIGFDPVFGTAAFDELVMRLIAADTRMVHVRLAAITSSRPGLPGPAEVKPDDHGKAFFNVFGHGLGLSEGECRNLHRRILFKKGVNHSIFETLAKIPLSLGFERLLELYFGYRWPRVLERIPGLGERKSYLFNCLPVSVHVDQKTIRYRLFGFIPLLKIQYRMHRRYVSYYAFNIIPLFKTRFPED